MSRLSIVLISCLSTSVACAQQLPAAQKVKKSKRQRTDESRAKDQSDRKTLILSESRSYRLDVKKLYPEADVALATQWVFRDEFPSALLAAIKKSGALKKSAKHEVFLDEKGKPEKDSGYIRWAPGEKNRKGTGALLWYVNGVKRKELVVSVDLVLDHKLGAGQKTRSHSFDQLRVRVNLKDQAKISNVKWGNIALPNAGGKRKSVEIENTLQVSVAGSLSEKTCRSIKMADELLAEAVTRSFGNLWQMSFSNESHHGITLGWLGYNHLRHGLGFNSGDGEDAIDFRYTISGNTFPLMLVRRQLERGSWPVVLHSSEYVGTSQDGVNVFRPVEFILSREVAETSPKKSAKKPAKSKKRSKKKRGKKSK